jgi:hypothetical protein
MSMRVKFAGVAMAVALLLGAANAASAHHAFGVEFDGDKCMDLHGVLTGLQWENPHAYIEVDVTDASGQAVTWRLEMITPNALKRNGSPSIDFQANMGKPIQTRSCPARPGAGENRGAVEYLKMADGLIRIVGQVVERELRPQDLSFWD